MEQFYEMQAELAEQFHEQLARDAAIAGVASQQKPIHSIIDKNKKFFDGIKGVQSIHIYGFSFSEIDIPYLEAIINVVGVEKTLWEITDFEGKERTKIEKFISNHKIKNYKILESICVQGVQRWAWQDYILGLGSPCRPTGWLA